MAKLQSKLRAIAKASRSAKPKKVAASKKSSGAKRSGIVKSATGYPPSASAAEEKAFMRKIMNTKVSSSTDASTDYDAWLG